MHFKFLNDKDLHEDFTVIDNKNCYGIDNETIIECLVNDGYLPIKVIKKDGIHLHYFVRSETFDYDLLFHKGMLEGWLPNLMVKLMDIYGEDQGAFSCL